MIRLSFWVAFLSSLCRRTASDDADVSRYLRAVYPSLSEDASPEDKRRLFESLEYYYACSDERAKQMTPPARCVAVTELPYVPSGEYFVAAVDAARDWASLRSLKWTAPASRSRWLRPSRSVSSRESSTNLFSTIGSRLGPAPSWTNPMALIKARVEHEELKAEGGFYFLEIENFGGPTWVMDCTRTKGVPVCGLWANVYKGTGTFIKLTAISTLVTQSKATAIVEMLRRLDSEQILEVADHLGTIATSAEDLVATLYARERPCSHVEDLDARSEWESWSKTFSDSPREIVERIANHRREPLDWLLGICGYGTLYEKNRRKPFTGFDGLLAVLACFNGITAIVLTVSSNDNGGFMRELIDYDTPRLWAGDCLPMPFTRVGGPRKKKRREDDEIDGASAPPVVRNQLPSVDELYDYWNHTGKFVLKDPLSPSLDNDTNDDNYFPIRKQPCVLERHSNVEVCRSTLLAQPNPLDPLHNCYMWCRDAMSQSHALISDVHMHWPSQG